MDDRSPNTVSDGAANPTTQSSDPGAQTAAPSDTAAPSSLVCPAGSASCDAAQPGAPASATNAGACAVGNRRCVDGAPELCSAGGWVPGGACSEPLPFCLPSSGACVSCEPGTKRCTGSRVEGCADDGAWQDLGMPCSECVPGAAGCVGDTARVCSALGAWVGQTCADRLPLCVPETGSCACTESSCGPRELCASSGRCEPLGSDCPPIAPAAPADQDTAIVRVRFDPDGSADVLIQNVGAGLVSFGAQGYQLCNGMNNCVYLTEAQSVTLLLGDSFSRRIPNTLPSGGELAIVGIFPDNPIFTEAYLAWGSGAAGGSFEAVVNNELRLWNTGERIAIDAGDGGFVSTGDTTRASGYSSCNPGSE
ncbi:MAG TPA: hypothetical protein VFS67_23235 [Polyangiaceae bacterium]|nr:hypothetical protein [Polyangiaceae bacterium]